jgi:hypothetical protein
MSAVGITLIVILWSGGLRIFAQDREAPSTSKIGYIDLQSKVKVDDVVLGAGRYQVQHLVRGGEDFMVFSERIVPVRGGIIWLIEVARARCSVESAGGRNPKTTLQLRANPEGLNSIEVIYVKGETVRHVLTNAAQ